MRKFEILKVYYIKGKVSYFEIRSGLKIYFDKNKISPKKVKMTSMAKKLQDSAMIKCGKLQQ